jgi:hypothetical protein
MFGRGAPKLLSAGEDARMPDEPDVLYLDPDNVRKAELCHQPPVANACGSRWST